MRCSTRAARERIRARERFVPAPVNVHAPVPFPQASPVGETRSYIELRFKPFDGRWHPL